MEILLGSASGADILWGILIEIPGDAAMLPLAMGCKFDSICGQLVVNIAHTTCVRSKHNNGKNAALEQSKQKPNDWVICQRFATRNRNQHTQLTREHSGARGRQSKQQQEEELSKRKYKKFKKLFLEVAYLLNLLFLR